MLPIGEIYDITYCMVFLHNTVKHWRLLFGLFALLGELLFEELGLLALLLELLGHVVVLALLLQQLHILNKYNKEK